MARADSIGSEAEVIFSPELFSIQNYGGVARYFIELIRGIDQLGVEWVAWAGHHGSDPLDILKAEFGDQRRILGRNAGRLPGRLAVSFAGEWSFRHYLMQTSGRSAGRKTRGVIHRTQYPLIDLTPAGFRKVSTLHDMWTERHGRSRGDAIRSHFKRSAIDRSDVVVCVSEYTRQSVLEVWPDMSDRLTVIHHGADPVSGTPVDPGYPWPYLLYVGQRELRKNFPILLRGLAHAHGLRDVRLVCAGGEPLTGDELAMIDQLGLTGRVVQRQANDHELAGLYEGAEALLYPSRYEGFGMPLLEAMLHGCLVVCSPLTCLPEIGGDAVVYVDADSAEGWAQAMQDAIANGTRMQELRDKALARASTFSWKSAARKYKEIYESLR